MKSIGFFLINVKALRILLTLNSVIFLRRYRSLQSGNNIDSTIEMAIGLGIIFKDKTSFENSKRNWKNKYSQIINKISEEQAELKNLGERHPAVINMLNTRGVDDLNKDQVFVELKTRLKI